MESGAKGCEVVVSGKLRAARAKSMKFTDGFMIHSGQPAVDFVDYAVRHVMLRQGVLGIKVKMYVLHMAIPQMLLLFLTLGLQHEGLGSRRPDRPPKTSARLRPNSRPTSGQDRFRAVFRTKGTYQCSSSCPSGGSLPATTTRGGLPGGAVRRVRSSLLILLTCLYSTYSVPHVRSIPWGLSTNRCTPVVWKSWRTVRNLLELLFVLVARSHLRAGRSELRLTPGTVWQMSLVGSNLVSGLSNM